MLNVIMLSVIMLSVFMLNVIMLSVIMLSVMGPFQMQMNKWEVVYVEFSTLS